MTTREGGGSTAVIYAGAAMGIFSVSEWGIIIGIICTVSGLVYNIYHTTKIRNEAKEYSEARLVLLDRLVEEHPHVVIEALAKDRITSGVEV